MKKRTIFALILASFLITTFVLSGSYALSGAETITPIAEIHGNDSAGKIPNKDQEYTVRGWVMVDRGIIFPHDPPVVFYLQDKSTRTVDGVVYSPGICIYDGDRVIPADIEIKEGYYMEITGKKIQYNALTELAPTSYKIISTTTTLLSEGLTDSDGLPLWYSNSGDITLGGTELKSTEIAGQPLRVTVNMMDLQASGGNDGPEQLEGRLVMIEDCIVLQDFPAQGQAWQPGTHLIECMGADGSKVTVAIQENSDVPGSPSFPRDVRVDIIGIVAQYDRGSSGSGGTREGSDDKLLDGHQLIPRYYSDFRRRPVETANVLISKKFLAGPSDTMYIVVTDSGIAVNKSSTTKDTLSVVVKSETDPVGFDITLTETGNNTGIFKSANFGVSEDATVAGSAIKVRDGDEISVTYIDAKDKNGNTNQTVIAKAYYKASVSAPKIELSHRIFSPDRNETVTIKYNAPYNTANPGSNYKVTLRIFDLKGREVKKLHDWLVVEQGITTWDGKDEDNRAVPIGSYIVHMEVLEPSGRPTASAMKVITVATPLQ